MAAYGADVLANVLYGALSSSGKTQVHLTHLFFGSYKIYRTPNVDDYIAEDHVTVDRLKDDTSLLSCCHALLMISGLHISLTQSANNHLWYMHALTRLSSSERLDQYRYAYRSPCNR